MLLYAIVTITLALAFYTVGVWSEKLQGGLKKWHVMVFWVGFLFDTTGTTLMGRLAGGDFTLNFHGITGLAAIVLMLAHAVWATVVLFRNNLRQKKNFHRLSIIVWVIWLVPFISGMILGMSR